MREKAVLINMNQKDVQEIYRCSSRMGIGVIVADKDKDQVLLEKLAECPLYKGGTVGEASGKSVVLMCEFTEKHFDKLLDFIKHSDVHVDFKAVLTPTNMKWDSRKLIAHMEFESMQKR